MAETPPAKYFTPGEKAIWRNGLSWSNREEEWVDLPGPAAWWPESDTKLDATGFYISDGSWEGHFLAYKMMREPQEPQDGSYQRIYPSNAKLFVIENTVAT
jgi:hypothetical protein